VPLERADGVRGQMSTWTVSARTPDGGERPT
jgi:hypothetical protein